MLEDTTEICLARVAKVDMRSLDKALLKWAGLCPVVNLVGLTLLLINLAVGITVGLWKHSVGVVILFWRVDLIRLLVIIMIPGFDIVGQLLL